MSRPNLTYLLPTEGLSLATVDSFISGRPFRHEDGSVVHFMDDRWRVQTNPPARKQVTLNFERLPLWMRPYAKRYIAGAWLGQGRSMSSLNLALTSLQNAEAALLPFAGPSFSQLTPDHAKRVHDWLQARWQAGQQAIMEAAEKTAEVLAPRERKRVLRKAQGLESGSISGIVRHLNDLIRLAREDGQQVDCWFRKPKEVKERHRKVGGADPQKVLTAEELGGVIAAAQQDVDEYRQALDELHAIFAPVDLAQYRRSEAWDRFVRYLGLDGCPMQSLQEIARADRRDAGSMGRTLRGQLAEAVGDSMARNIWHLRSMLRTNSGVPPAEQEHARDALAALLEECDLTALRRLDRSKYLIAFVLYFGLEGHRLHSWIEVVRHTGLSRRLIRFETERYLANMLGDVARAERAKELRREINWLYPRAIKASALQLLAVTFRRVSAPLLSLTSEPELRRARHRGQNLVGLRTRAYKAWGDEGVPEWIEVPGFHGEVLERAVETAKELTAPLRPCADEAFRDVLFLIPVKPGALDRATPLTDKVLHEYVYVNQSGKDGGLLRRRRIPGAERISIHCFRHTHITTILSAGGSARMASRIAGNSPIQSATAYTAMGTQEMREQSARLLDAGAATGYLFDAVLRVVMEAGGELDPSLPASQLSFGEALRRLKENPQLLSDYLQGDLDPTPEAALRLLGDGLVLNLTSKGACILPAEEGPCPASEDCPIGCDPERNQTDPGCGCRWQVKLPHDDAVAAYEGDLATMRAVREQYAATSGYEVWVRHFDQRIAIWQMQLDTLYQLQSVLDGSSADV